jgi:hypothetical protein
VLRHEQGMQKWAKRGKIQAPWPLYGIAGVVKCRSLTLAVVGGQGGESKRTESWRDTCCKMFIWREENIKLDVSEMIGGWEMDGSTISSHFPRCSLVLTVHETLV